MIAAQHAVVCVCHGNTPWQVYKHDGEVQIDRPTRWNARIYAPVVVLDDGHRGTVRASESAARSILLSARRDPDDYVILPALTAARRSTEWSALPVAWQDALADQLAVPARWIALRLECDAILDGYRAEPPRGHLWSERAAVDALVSAHVRVDGAR